MKPNAPRIFAACLLLACAVPHAAHGQSPQPSARKFDEFTTDSGGVLRHRWGDAEAGRKELTARLLRYAAQLRKEGARPYVITYGPRVVEWHHTSRSVASSNAGGLWPDLTAAGFDGLHINWANGGFREEATTELWVVPPGAQPPCPTPTVRPEDVAYCPHVYAQVTGGTYVPRPSAPLSFKASVSVNSGKVSPKFAWTVSQGRIVEGQGTETIAVELPEGASGTVVAKVEVQGYSLECPVGATTAQAKTSVGVSRLKFDEFGDIRQGDTKARLDNLAVELDINPALQAHLVVYGGRNGPRGQAAGRAHWLKTYLVTVRGIDAGRVFTVEGGFRNELSAELWLSPPGTPAPPVSPTLDEGYATPKGDVRRKP